MTTFLIRCCIAILLRSSLLAAAENLDAWEENEATINQIQRAHHSGQINTGVAGRKMHTLLQTRYELLENFDQSTRRRLRINEHELQQWLNHPQRTLQREIDRRLGYPGFGETPLAQVTDALTYTPPDHQTDEENILADISINFPDSIVPLLNTYCMDCHDTEHAEGDIDLESALQRTPLVRNRLLWENVDARIRNHDMPPRKNSQPTSNERLQLRAWLHQEIVQFDYSKVRNPGIVPGRRLSREEYNRTIRDLVGLDVRPADQFPMDFTGTSGFSNSANTLYLQSTHLDRYVTAAEEVIDTVRANPAAWQRLIIEPKIFFAAEQTDSGPHSTIRRFMHRAYRRPPTASELNAAMSRHANGLKKGEEFALAEAFKFILISPAFLMRIESSPTDSGDQLVSDHDLASRLSYFIWASMPDDALLHAAANGQLQTSGGRQQQVKRLLADPRSRSLGDLFAGEWLGIDDLGPRIRKDPTDHPWCTESLMKAMREETALFVHSLIQDNAPVARLLDADYTFINEELAHFYRLPGVEGRHMRRVSLTSNQRGGLFGNASVLAITSFPERTSPVVRGAWILETLLGTPPPPPPPNVPEIDVEGSSPRAVRTLRARLERHRTSPKCAGCHDQIDPLGFALENYAEFGQWRSGVDNHGTLPDGATFSGPSGLKKALIDTRLDNLGRQVIRKMLSYALGRQLEYYDEAVVREIAAELKVSGYPMQELVLAIADSYPMLYKRHQHE